MNKILVATTHRCGSTALYNIVRFCLLRSNKGVYSSWYGFYDEKRGPLDTHVVKIHNFDNRFLGWADMVLTAKRDLRDIMGSLKRFSLARGRDFNFDDELRRCVYYYNAWDQYSDYEFIYEDFFNNPIGIIDEIAKTIGVAVSANDVHADLRRITEHPRGFGLCTQHLLTHPSHVGSMKPGCYAEHLTAEEVSGIYKYGKI